MATIVITCKSWILSVSKKKEIIEFNFWSNYSFSKLSGSVA